MTSNYLSRKFLAVFLAALSSSLWFSQAWAELSYKQAYVREMPPGHSVTAAFLQLENSGNEAEQLVSIRSSSAERVEMHQHIHQQGRMRMQQLESITVPAGGSFSFQPGAYHLMLIDLKRNLRAGEQVELLLCFESGKTIQVNATVKSIR